MSGHVGPIMQLALGLLLLLDWSLASQSPAHVQSEYGQLVTSSTLMWVSGGVGQSPPQGAISAGTGGGRLVCRGRQHGSTLLGTTENGRCLVGFTNRLLRLTQYHILTSVHGAARLEWVSFNRFGKVPKGAVAGADTSGVSFVARQLDGAAMKPAVLEMPQSGLGFGVIRVYSDHGVKEINEGDLLMEVEPVRYELELDKFIKVPRKDKESKTLATASIFRFEEGQEDISRMQKVLSYDYEKSLYFGQIKGAIRGLPSTVRLPSGETKSVVWGTKERGQQRETLMVGFDMERNSAVDVAVVATRVVEEQTFTALLTAVFKDGSRRERKVEGVMQRTYLDNIRPEYSKLYKIKDQIAATLAPRTTPIWVETQTAHRRESRGREQTQTRRESSNHLLMAVQSSGGSQSACSLLTLVLLLSLTL